MVNGQITSQGDEQAGAPGVAPGRLTREEIEKLAPEQLEAIESQIRAARAAARTRGIVDEICALPAEEAKTILCNVARGAQSSETGWQKYIISTISKQMPKPPR